MKFLNYFCSLFFAVALLVSCSEEASEVDQDDLLDNYEDDSSDGETVIQATLSFEVDGAVAPDSLIIANSVDAVLVVSIITNQEASTIEYSIDDEGAAWCDVSLVDTLLTITTLTKNEGVVARSAQIGVSVGDAKSSTMEGFVVMQYPDDIMTFVLSADSVKLANYAGDSGTVTVTTNQPLDSIKIARVDDTLDALFDYARVGQTITFTTKEASQVEEEVAQTFVISVSNGDKVMIDSVVVAQAPFEAATLSVVGEGAIALTNEINSSDNVEVETNQNITTIEAKAADEDNFSVSVSGTTITVKALSVNNTGTEVYLWAGADDNIARDTLYVTQSAEVRLEMSNSLFELRSTSESTATIEVATNQEASTIKASVDTAGESYFSAEVVGSKVTVKALQGNTTADNITSKVTITVGVAGYTDSKDVAISQSILAVGDFIQGGVIFWISDNRDTAKIVHPTEGFPVQWYAEQKATVLVGANSDDDGEYNMTQIKAASDYSTGRYHIVDWCEEFGEGWYLPARYELSALLAYAYDDDFNLMLTTNGGDALTQGQFFWSSTEYSETNAYTPRNKEGALDTALNYGKYNNPSTANGGRYVRAIKKIEL